MENWGTFATVAGTAAASLTGLLFVAVSIRTDVIVRLTALAGGVTTAWLLLTKIPE